VAILCLFFEERPSRENVEEDACHGYDGGDAAGVLRSVEAITMETIFPFFFGGGPTPPPWKSKLRFLHGHYFPAAYEMSRYVDEQECVNPNTRPGEANGFGRMRE